jgi:hypothetical protein
VTALKRPSNERESITGKEPEGSAESGSPGVHYLSARSLRDSSRNREAEKRVTGAGRAEEYVAEQKAVVHKQREGWGMALMLSHLLSFAEL